MSLPLLRETTRARIQDRIDQECGFLVARTSDSIDEIRVRQGKIAGLTEALEILGDAYREMN